MAKKKKEDELLGVVRKGMLDLLYDVQVRAYEAGKANSAFPDLDWLVIAETEKISRILAASYRMEEAVRETLKEYHDGKLLRNEK